MIWGATFPDFFGPDEDYHFLYIEYLTTQHALISPKKPLYPDEYAAMVPLMRYYDYGYGGQSAYGYGGGDSGQYGDQGNGQYGASSPTVTLRGTAFNPAQLTVKAGQDVVWSWNDGGVAHTVTADDGTFDSGRMTSGTYRHVFDHPGEFHYHCQIHPQQMMGTVVVTQ